ncbi:MAG TPA: hypothetical protein VNN10_08390 [Dehalococcoidia bacterium]|nr:hypothetical protein [Dehalococcoidia bacterium]
MEKQDDYVTIEEAARSLGLTAGQMRRALRQYGFGDLLRATMRKQISIRREDLEKLRAVAREQPGRKGAA